LFRKEEERLGALAKKEKRVLQHNLRVVAGVYSACTIPRLCALANGITPPTLEAQVSELVANGSVHAKVNRPAGVVHFGKRRPPTEVLSDWASDMDGCLNKVEMVVHLLRKEEQMAAALARAQKA
jgi:26S proteasome regulatory subunit N5